MTTKTFGKRGLAASANASPLPPRPTVSVGAVILPHPIEPSDALDSAERLFAQVPILTVGLIAILLLIYGIEKRLAFEMNASNELSLLSLKALGASGYDLVVGAREVWRPFVAPLLHASYSHVIGNAFALFFVGIRLEPLIGRAWFLAIFAISALGGGISSMIGNSHEIVTVGASGAITGLIGALFAVSFNDRVDEEDRSKMRATALKFGVPALAPLAFGASGHTDYLAHLGGAIAGVAVAWAVCAVWSEDRARPNFAGFAMSLFLTFLMSAIVGCLFASHGYAGYRARAAQLIPTSQLPKTLLLSERQSAALLARYPQDPMAHVIRGIYLATHHALPIAKTELRSAIDLAGDATEKRVAREVARGLLAAILADEGRRDEAKALADGLCHQQELESLRAALQKAKVCA